MEYKDYYKVLGVERSASADEIKKAYRKLVRQYHPDVSKHKDADAKTKEINEAYDVLGDAEKRAAFDALGQGPRPGQGFQPPPDWGSQFDFGGAGGSDFFSDLFANIGRGGARRGGMGGAGGMGGMGGGFNTRGEDIHAAISIDLRDAYQGATRNVSLRVPQQDAQGRTGTRDKTLSVNIPKGVTPGQQLRLGGQGHPGTGGGAAGDLYLEIQLNPDARYRLEGAHVYQNVPVTPWEAALGAAISVPTPSGSIEVNVPAGSQGGRKLRLKGRGIPAAQAGDLYLVLDVVLPPATSDRARELYETMARDLAFNPRERTGA
ncbi:J domain-containing protein [Massilia forsythiae]|uniref:J domain-containing protein n=1 Tax=Massilia forsythiae TaxID=2728020 RepID=A0A7Z2ZQW8_9BURK|nr:J domain-containing protein [Massilia forsythiae]QJD98855.1 J domain-containing protein [Massilia forsythiae]